MHKRNNSLGAFRVNDSIKSTSNAERRTKTRVVAAAVNERRGQAELCPGCACEGST